MVGDGALIRNSLAGLFRSARLLGAAERHRTMVGGNQSEAARGLGLHCGSFVKVLNKYWLLAG